MKITKQTTKKQILAMGCLSKHFIYDCHEGLTDDEDVVLKFIESYWDSLRYASDRLKSDREFIKRAIQKDVACFLYADDSLRKNKQFIIELVELSNPMLINFAYYTVKEEMYEHLKPHVIDILKNELKKEDKQND